MKIDKFPEFTYEQKCRAFGAFYYLAAEGRHKAWLPTEGSYYTIRRGDLELFRIEKLRDDGVAVVTSNAMISTMNIQDFGEDSFHAERVPVPDHILGIKE